MVSVKIECGCGQRYAFDVEPVEGRMNAAVACPVCGADGTAAANAVLATKVPPPFTGAPAPLPSPSPSGTHLRVPETNRSAPPVPAGVKLDARALGLVDRDTAEIEARAKISWGDSQEDVIKYLMLQGFSVDDASELVAVMFKERMAALRIKGTKKICLGVGLMFVPVIAWFSHLAAISLKLMGGAIGVGLWGAWLVLNGIIMVVAPKLEKGDVAD
jgi:hypothetical protein